MSSGEKLCFNSNCKEACDEWRRGWRRRTGDYANLCDRCSSAYEDGKFCETFHANASGWRCCESCGKQIHCGCIVSFHMFVLLDAGGIECLTCARKSYILTPNPAWPPPSHFLHSQSDKMKEFSVKSWSAIAGSGPVPLHHTPSLLKHSDFQSEVQTKRSHGRINILGGIEWIPTSQGISSPESKEGSSYERLVNGKLKIGSLQTLGNSGLDVKEHSYSFDNSSKPVVPSNNSFSPNVGLATGSLQTKKDYLRFSAILPQAPAILGPSRKQCFQVGMKSSGECQMSNGKSQADCCGRNQLLPRYRPQITDEELQQISSNTKAVITPLFEKMLSASDAGRIGRLVLPKKCAEAYFPRIASPDGLPLKVLDVNGKEWVFQFRFWPNNNSRMYVLEGITPCIQSLKLQAGDVVTFSWLEQEGKFVIGGRKSSAIQSAEQGDEFTIIRNDASAQGDGSSRNKFRAAIPVDGHVKGKLLKDKAMLNTKRKNNNLSAKSKRLRINTEDMIELKLTWKEAQRLMRPTAKTDTSIFVVEGCEFEEFEDDAPVIGRPTILGNDFGKEIQWVQCEECFKWRKVPADALLLSRWICSENVWDVGRSLCSAAEELSKEHLEHMLPTVVEDYAIKKETSEQDTDPFVDLEGLDALANLAFLGEGDATPASSETKHPRHKFGCPCVVCLQPPSRKGHKHKQSCECTSCISMKHRFRTLMERSEKKQYESGAEPSSPNSLCHQLPGKMQVVEDGNSTLNQEEVSKWDHLDEVMGRKSSTSPLKGQVIDLNIQPEREEDLSTGSDSVPLKSSVEGSGDRPLLSQRSLDHTSSIIQSLVTKQMQPDGIGGSNLISCMAVDGGHRKSG